MNIFSPSSLDPFKPFICPRCMNRSGDHMCNQCENEKAFEEEKIYKENIERHIKEFEEKMMWPKPIWKWPGFITLAYSAKDYNNILNYNYHMKKCVFIISITVFLISLGFFVADFWSLIKQYV